MQAGQLKTPITIQAPTIARDATGKAVYTYSDVRNTWADVFTNPNDHVDEADGILASDRFQLRLRFMPDLEITTQHRLIYAGRQWQVTGYEDVRMRHKDVVLDIEEVGT